VLRDVLGMTGTKFGCACALRRLRRLADGLTSVFASASSPTRDRKTEGHRHRQARKRRKSAMPQRTWCGHAEHVAQHPEKRGILVDVDTMQLAVER